MRWWDGVAFKLLSVSNKKTTCTTFISFNLQKKNTQQTKTKNHTKTSPQLQTVKMSCDWAHSQDAFIRLIQQTHRIYNIKKGIM